MDHPGSVSAARAALDDYLDALNRRDEAGMNAAFNFPHVRLASGTVTVFEKRGDYRFEGFRARSESDWDHTVWNERDVVHSSPDKIHFAVRFTRCRADGSTIADYRSLWIVTCVDDHWGVQARSSFAA